MGKILLVSSLIYIILMCKKVGKDWRRLLMEFHLCGCFSSNALKTVPVELSVRWLISLSTDLCHVTPRSLPHFLLHMSSLSLHFFLSSCKKKIGSEVSTHNIRYKMNFSYQNWCQLGFRVSPILENVMKTP